MSVSFNNIVFIGCEDEMLDLGLREMDVVSVTGNINPAKPPGFLAFSVEEAGPGAENSFTFRIPSPGPDQPQSLSMISLRVSGLRSLSLFGFYPDGTEYPIGMQVKLVLSLRSNTHKYKQSQYTQ